MLPFRNMLRSTIGNFHNIGLFSNEFLNSCYGRYSKSSTVSDMSKALRSRYVRRLVNDPWNSDIVVWQILLTNVMLSIVRRRSIAKSSADSHVELVELLRRNVLVAADVSDVGSKRYRVSTISKQRGRKALKTLRQELLEMRMTICSVMRLRKCSTLRLLNQVPSNISSRWLCASPLYRLQITPTSMVPTSVTSLMSLWIRTMLTYQTTSLNPWRKLSHRFPIATGVYTRWHGFISHGTLKSRTCVFCFASIHTLQLSFLILWISGFFVRCPCPTLLLKTMRLALYACFVPSHAWWFDAKLSRRSFILIGSLTFLKRSQTAWLLLRCSVQEIRTIAVWFGGLFA